MMKKLRTVQIELTPEQTKQLQPLFDAAAKHRQSGFVFGQAWDGDDAANITRGLTNCPTFVFRFCTPEEVIDLVKQSIILRDTITPL